LRLHPEGKRNIVSVFKIIRCIWLVLRFRQTARASIHIAVETRYFRERPTNMSNLTLCRSHFAHYPEWHSFLPTQFTFFLSLAQYTYYGKKVRELGRKRVLLKNTQQCRWTVSEVESCGFELSCSRELKWTSCESAVANCWRNWFPLDLLNDLLDYKF